MKTRAPGHNFLWIAMGSATLQLFAQTPSPEKSTALANLAPFAVIELFTSEGCSSCPPADKYLNDLVEQAHGSSQRVFPLAFHVDYWDYLGWRDDFSDSRFTERQREYARHAGTGQIYTPQMIVNGETAFVGSDRQQGDALIAQALRRPAQVDVKVQAVYDSHAQKVSVTLEASPALPGSAVRVAVVQRGLRREIRSGENHGRVLMHENVVRAFATMTLHAQSSNQFALSLPADFKGGSAAVIAYVQDAKTDRILGAASVPF